MVGVGLMFGYLVYVIYIFGFIGCFKGVMVEYVSLVCWLIGVVVCLGLGLVVMVNLLLLVFDILFLEQLLLLVSGGCVVMLDGWWVCELDYLVSVMWEVMYFYVVVSLVEVWSDYLVWSGLVV